MLLNMPSHSTEAQMLFFMQTSILPPANLLILVQLLLLQLRMTHRCCLSQSDQCSLSLHLSIHLQVAMYNLGWVLCVTSFLIFYRPCIFIFYWSAPYATVFCSHCSFIPWHLRILRVLSVACFLNFNRSWILNFSSPSVLSYRTEPWQPFTSSWQSPAKLIQQKR